MYVCMFIYIYTYIHIYIYKTRLTSNEIFSPSNKIHREECRPKDLSAPVYIKINFSGIMTHNVSVTFHFNEKFADNFENFMKSE
jgi:hypothetical protein